MRFSFPTHILIFSHAISCVTWEPNIDAAIGNQPANISGGDRPFDGWIDEVRIYGGGFAPAELDSVMTAAVEECSQEISSYLNYGNNTFRRAIACASSFDSLYFEPSISDTIWISDTPIDINSSMQIKGLDNLTTKIANSLLEPGLSIGGLPIQVTMEDMNFYAEIGPFLFNAGMLSINDVHMKGQENSILSLVQNVGKASVLCSFLLSYEE